MNKSAKVSKREILKERKRKEQVRKRAIFIIAIAVVALIIAAILIYPSLQPLPQITSITPNPVFHPQGLSMGDPNAPVKVEEFADFQCPYCKEFDLNEEANFINTYVVTGKVYFTYTPFSFIDQNVPGGNKSHAAAEAAYCASDQGKFWQYHDLLYANQTGENIGDFTDKRLAAYAQALGLNMSQFNSCYSSGKYKQQVIDDYNKAINDNITQTPSFLVNGTTIAYMTDLNSKVDAALGTGTQGSSPSATATP